MATLCLVVTNSLVPLIFQHLGVVATSHASGASELSWGLEPGCLVTSYFCSPEVPLDLALRRSTYGLFGRRLRCWLGITYVDRSRGFMLGTIN